MERRGGGGGMEVFAASPGRGRGRSRSRSGYRQTRGMDIDIWGVLAASPGMSRRRDIGIGVNMWTGLTLQLEMHRRLESQPHSRSSSECVRG